MRQLCWRDFNHQLLAAQPGISTEDLRPRDHDWRDDDEGFEAWREGRTGFPLVDAGSASSCRKASCTTAPASSPARS